MNADEENKTEQCLECGNDVGKCGSCEWCAAYYAMHETKTYGERTIDEIFHWY